MHVLEFFVIFQIFEAAIGENDDFPEVVKMIKVYGKVTGDNFADALDLPIEDCIDKCFAMPECILSHMDSNNHCILHTYDQTAMILNVVETTKSYGYYVAFKSEIDDTCPDSYNDINFNMSVGSNIVAWEKTNDGWTFKKCEQDWQIFYRADSVVVCMRAFHVAQNITKAQSILECESMGKKLTGVASREESDWIKSQLSEPKDTWYGYAIDGLPESLATVVMVNDKKCNVTDICRSFKWSDGYTTSQAALTEENASISGAGMTCDVEECLTVADNEKPINDINCNDKQFGYVCGYQLK